MQLKKWDCIEHRWKWFFYPVKQPLHNSFWFVRKYLKIKYEEKYAGYWGEIWLLWLKIPIKRISIKR